jgi:hypothetical protein
MGRPSRTKHRSLTVAAANAALAGLRRRPFASERERELLGAGRPRAGGDVEASRLAVR